MSPIDENELRSELWYAAPGTPQDGSAADHATLTATVLDRGRRVRRRRAIAGGVAGVLLLGAVTYGVGTWLENTGQRAVPITQHTTRPTVAPTGSPGAPSGSPVPSASTGAPSGSPSATPVDPGWPGYAGDGLFPADFGDLGSFRLLHEGTPATDEVTAWEETPVQVRLCQQALPAAYDVVAGRQISARGPADMGWDEQVLLFRSDEAASAYVAQVRSFSFTDEACTRDQTDGWRNQWATSAVDGLGDEAVGVSWWQQHQVDGTWGDAPGGSLFVSVRQGRAVFIASTFGEYVGDPLAAGALDELRPFFTDALDQAAELPS